MRFACAGQIYRFFLCVAPVAIPNQLTFDPAITQHLSY